MGKHSNNPYTKRLREAASKCGAFYTTGIELSNGHRIMENTITNIWAKDQSRMVSFEEHEDGGLRCDDPITAMEALRMLGYEEPTEVSEDSVSVSPRPSGIEIMRRGITAQLLSLNLGAGTDSHSRLSKICSVIYFPPNGWTPAACEGLVARICALLRCASDAGAKGTSDA